jgi:hypothetical protein
MGRGLPILPELVFLLVCDILKLFGERSCP